ncbi:MAG: DEAD/DEAH box helicase, partial [Proteobacteria bacterium]|nr:DEAD/DEAH box helicase [Pseudomonadota bacterium]
MFATVRNRRGIVSAVEPFDGQEGRLHLVHLDYKDDQLPAEERLLWELEPRKVLLEPTALPDAVATDPMPGEDFDALLRAARWTAATPFLDPDGGGPLDRLPISSPFHGAVQIEDFQLVPLLKALQMPRVNLLIADDVGLGKTIEAGLILSELLLRRRIQRVLILTPASLRLQWRDEMWEKFSLPFDLVDRAETHALHRRLGMDANPWRSFSRIIASYHYLRQEDVLTQFLAACRTPEGSPHLPWDLLIVDECHNLMPSPFGDDSDLCRMLRLLAPQFEHRLFLSATPHNGHTRSFTGLLEILDPVRFSQTDELKKAERERVQQVVLRRLKREINARTSPPRFCRRNPPQALVLELSPQEIALSTAFDGFRTAIRRLAASGETRRRRAGSFAVEILGKRLLSCPTAFAESWRRCREGLAEGTAADETDVIAAKRNVERETGDDRETQSREATAAGVVGAWLKAVAADLQSEIAEIDKAVADMGFDLSRNDLDAQNPAVDARFDALAGL